MFRQATINEFIQETKNIVCFGAGRQVEKLVEIFNNTPVLSKIKYFLDNSPNKIGGTVTLGDRNVDIISVEQFKNLHIKDCSILITIVNFFDVVEQIKREETLNKTNIYILSNLINNTNAEEPMKKELPANIKLTESPAIPKTIHYCWFGGNPIPDKYKKWMESWQKFCPDYEIKEWNESNYDITKNKYMYQAYQAKKWGFVPDYARFDIVYQYGGIYLDTDVELVKNLDDLLYQQGFAGFESDKFVALGLGFGAAKGNPIIKSMRDDYDDRSFIKEDGTINTIASPVLQTDVLLKFGLQLNGEYQILGDNFAIFPEKMFCGKSLSTRRIQLKSYTHSIHHYDASWLNNEAKQHVQKLEQFYAEQNNSYEVY